MKVGTSVRQFNLFKSAHNHVSMSGSFHVLFEKGAEYHHVSLAHRLRMPPEFFKNNFFILEQKGRDYKSTMYPHLNNEAIKVIIQTVYKPNVTLYAMHRKRLKSAIGPLSTSAFSLEKSFELSQYIDLNIILLKPKKEEEMEFY
ncbi:MAG: hypothetical protein JZD41_02615 [Thermoproteus sp.]|nr:hypothetical protein [Thermoproteus sp.]